MKYKAVEIINVTNLKWWEFLWGADIFISSIPIIKSVIVANIIANIIIWLIFIR